MCRIAVALPAVQALARLGLCVKRPERVHAVRRVGDYRPFVRWDSGKGAVLVPGAHDDISSKCERRVR